MSEAKNLTQDWLSGKGIQPQNGLQGGMLNDPTLLYKSLDIPRNYCSPMEPTTTDPPTKPIEKKTIVEFDSVIISDDKRKQIMEALEQHHQQDLIFDTWGFGETIEKGRGVIILFYGPPGTGKTLTAQAIAHQLGYKLNIIATADIESSVPGEPERKIREHFKEAKGKKTILLFDECDSLIYSRKNVGPVLAAQINELLSSIERFDGVVLFTTNRLGVLDEAVNRRIALKLEFEMPTAAERVLIWKRMFPKKAPLASNIDWDKLASIEITGGYIKNTVLRAARMAAAEKIDNAKKKIKMSHLVEALKQEVTSLLSFEQEHAQEESRYGHISPSNIIAQDDNGFARKEV